jgi:hypothetical protein
MPASWWLAWLATGAVAVGASWWHYARRETPGRGRGLLAVLRGAAFATVLLVLLDPELPARGAGAVRGTVVVLDASLSMTLPATAGGTVSGATAGVTRWQRGAALARERAGGRPVLLFGSEVRAVAAPPDSAPGDARSLLLPALQAVAESGLRRVVVITDGGIEDAEAVARWAPRLGLQIDTELVGADVPNRSLVEATAPQWVEAGQPARVEFAVGGTAGDSAGVVARRGGRVIGRVTVPGASLGRLATGSLELRLEAPPGGGWVPVELALEGDDAVPDDDRRTIYIQVGAEPAGIALVSFRPDWEPRFLGPVLARAVGLPLRAYLRTATGQYVRLAGGLEAGVNAPEAQVRRDVERAELVVLHGLGVDAPQWAVTAAGTARRVLLFPADGGEALAPVPVGAELAGDFYPAGAVPSSPVTPLLADLELDGVTPLSGLRPVELPAGAWAPLLATRGRQGAPLPVAVGGAGGGRRWVVALGSGYWQWSFRGGAERQLYTRLWSALGGWLTQERALGGAVKPARLASPRGAPLGWLAPGVAADSVAVTLTGVDGTVAADMVVPMAGRDTAYTAAPAPGAYTFHARAFAADGMVEARGEVTVERYSPELSRPRAQLDALSAPPATVRGGVERAGGTPLHATAWPYLVIVMLLAAEWVLRRRWGLR